MPDMSPLFRAVPHPVITERTTAYSAFPLRRAHTDAGRPASTRNRRLSLIPLYEWRAATDKLLRQDFASRAPAPLRRVRIRLIQPPLTIPAPAVLPRNPREHLSELVPADAADEAGNGIAHPAFPL